MEEGDYGLRTPFGDLRIEHDGRGVSEIFFGIGGAPAPQPLREYFDEYFSGRDPGPFPYMLNIVTTRFMLDVYTALQKVPFGSTVSYSELARLSGHPRASRAVGNAVGKNPLVIVIPCHRVIAAGGGLGGFSSGLDLKRDLLRLEGHSRFR